MIALLLACGTEPVVEEAPVSVSSVLPEDSIYQVDAVLETHTGAQVDLAVYRGHPTIISMFYANCPMACPMLIGDVQTLEDALSDEVRGDTRVLLVSLDPERDTPELMAGVVQTHQLDTDRWTLARTDPDTVRSIAAVLGIRYRALADGEMNHSSIVTVLDRDGRVVTTREGLRGDPGPLASAVSGL